MSRKSYKKGSGAFTCGPWAHGEPQSPVHLMSVNTSVLCSGMVHHPCPCLLEKVVSGKVPVSPCRVRMRCGSNHVKNRHSDEFIVHKTSADALNCSEGFFHLLNQRFANKLTTSVYHHLLYQTDYRRTSPRFRFASLGFTFTIRQLFCLP